MEPLHLEITVHFSKTELISILIQSSLQSILNIVVLLFSILVKSTLLY